jgi:hypothetical protein
MPHPGSWQMRMVTAGRALTMRLARPRLICLLWLCSAHAMWGGLPPTEGAEDIGHLAEKATFIFHAQVTSVVRVADLESSLDANLAELKVDRWYKGTPHAETVRCSTVIPGVFRIASICNGLPLGWFSPARCLMEPTGFHTVVRVACQCLQYWHRSQKERGCSNCNRI